MRNPTEHITALITESCSGVLRATVRECDRQIRVLRETLREVGTGKASTICVMQQSVTALQAVRELAALRAAALYGQNESGNRTGAELRQDGMRYINPGSDLLRQTLATVTDEERATISMKLEDMPGAYITPEGSQLWLCMTLEPSTDAYYYRVY